MRKVGKYEKMRKNAIMQTYITSLLCLVLCVTMFFGTTMAWFTDTTVSEGNEMYVGTLDVDLKHATFSGGTQQKTNENMDVVNETYQVFKKIENGGIRWEPGYTAVEKFELTENGDLAFSYQMSIARTFAETGEDAQKAIAQAITVWSYVGDDAESIEKLPVNFDELTAADWEQVGTLYDVITKELPVFKGQMDKDAVTKTKTEGQGEQQKTVDDPAKAYHLIALNMDKDYDGVISRDDNGKVTASVQGQTLDNITIKLVATQLPSEQDAFGSTYDDNIVLVSTEEKMAEQLAAGNNVLLNNNVTVNENAVMNGGTLDGNGNTLTVNTAGNDDCAITTTGGTVQNLTITGNPNNTRAIGAGSTGTYTLTEDLIIDNVKIDYVQYGINGSGNGTAKVIVKNSEAYGWHSFSNIALFSFENCKLGMKNCYDGYVVIYGDTNFTNCAFEGVFDLGARMENGAVCAAGKTVTFTNCTYDGVKVTADNFVHYFYYGSSDAGDFGNLMRECTIIVDGVKVDNSAYINN